MLGLTCLYALIVRNIYIKREREIPWVFFCETWPSIPFVSVACVVVMCSVSGIWILYVEICCKRFLVRPRLCCITRPKHPLIWWVLHSDSRCKKKRSHFDSKLYSETDIWNRLMSGGYYARLFSLRIPFVSELPWSAGVNQYECDLKGYLMISGAKRPDFVGKWDF